MPDVRPNAILPEPPDELKQVSRALTGQLRARIESDGFLSFRDYMEAALYTPGLGYYSAGLAKFGADGDFVTSPELGWVFSRCLAAQAADIGHEIGRWDILEIGAGSGRLAAGVLNALGEDGPGRYRILERSADLRAVQKDTIATHAAAHLDRVEWLDTPPDAPWDGVILANEVIDALAVERFTLADGVIRQLGVRIDGDGFAWDARNAPERLAGAAESALGERLGHLEDGYVSELCLDLPGWLATVTATLRRGVALMIDYGHPRDEYYRPERRDGTLVCHYRHRAHDDPFFWPGLQDLTAFVDFTAIAEAGDACGLDCAGYAPQAQFLIGCGMESVLAGMADLPDTARFDLAREVRMLTLPGAMGEKFQVMALARDFDTPLRGFGLADMRGYL
ncbi:class I SAM-dependent methyltransferase [Marinihelvus fidelis]|uniref:Class I SAM-dependent methyltransferase n=1 Tax=Marinihelvus fidelis TaxID=2613842 RepID=A0A5N0TAY4_9GAMM|nr:SAM-dependent methyltransferase [Marinihelvus fidelis]KAA9131307.1 class I SAM-dependent methyltransferase [Marinihelvus fidelis]